MPNRLLIILITGVLSVAAFTQEPATPLRLVIQAERDFARDSVTRGTREAFIAAFAPDGIGFQPQPIKVKEEFQQRPAPPGPRRGVLNWSPLIAEISQAGDMGYTTGPFVSENLQTHEKQHGMYSSVWQKQPDGSWKVALDIGVSLPRAAAPLDVSVTTSSVINTGRPLKYEAASGSLQAAEAEFIRLAGSHNFAAAYRLYAMDRMRLHRSGVMPLTSQPEILQWAEQQKHRAKLAVLTTEAARSGDFGYSYGSYEIQASEGLSEKGYYAHFWRRAEQDGWRLVLEVLNPLPKQ
ncbi:MAG: DUF4440 domain-containing protein [Blastocatellia bacterium]